MKKEDVFEVDTGEPDEILKEIKIQDTGRQLVLPIPAQVAEALKLKKGDIFIFKIPLDNVKDYSFKLKKTIK